MTGAIRILHLEDSARDAEIIQDRLESAGFQCEFRVVNTGETFEASLLQSKFDLILCDYNIPGYDGQTALKLANSALPAVPIIMISGGLSEYEAVDCLHLGATDYVLKQSLVRLPAAVDRAISQVRDKRLREQAESKFRWLLESAPDAMVIVDTCGRIVLVNSQAETLFGYDRSELLGQPVEVLMPPRFRGMHARLVQEFLLGHKSRKNPLPTELTGLRSDGVELPLEILLSPLEQVDETLTIAGIRDLTERKRLENLLSRTKRMESIGSFAGKIAHDLNNALAPVLMSLDLLRIQSTANPELIDIVESGAKHGAELLKQLLIFSKGSDLDPVRLDPLDLVGELAKFIGLTFPNNIELKIQAGDGVKALWGDRTQLFQVLMNLCGNARDAMPKGGVLTVGAHMVDIDRTYSKFVPDARPGRYVMFQVADTGTGMSPEVLERAFEPFYTTKPPGKGTGLGLSIVRGIVKSHYGFINIQSTEGRGSTFSIYIPADREWPDDIERAKCKAPDLNGNGALVLIVDDSCEIRIAASAVLTALNFTPLVAEDGPTALEIARKNAETLKVVITDLNMPYMDGRLLSAELHSSLPRLSIILMSGSIGHLGTQELNEFGVSTFLHKPFTQASLAEALQISIEN